MLENRKSNVYCVTGIDTDIGKTIVTGILAKSCRHWGIQAITQKMVQTGCRGVSEDILRHRELMNLPLQEIDLNGLTCPYVFPVPCSPHLAAGLAESQIMPEKIAEASASLRNKFELVLLEGAGGLLVPLLEDFTLLDYLEKYHLPIILVTSPRLGSINHTLAVLELAWWRKLKIAGIIYNLWEHQDQRIIDDSKAIFSQYLQKYAFGGPILEMPRIADDQDFCFSKKSITALFENNRDSLE